MVNCAIDRDHLFGKGPFGVNKCITGHTDSTLTIFHNLTHQRTQCLISFAFFRNLPRVSKACCHERALCSMLDEGSMTERQKDNQKRLRSRRGGEQPQKYLEA